MSNCIAGFKGQVYVSSDDGSSFDILGETRNADFNITRDPFEATSFDSNGWKEFCEGLGEWDMTTESLYLYNDTGQTEAQSSILAGVTTLVWRFIPEDASGNDGYEGVGIVSNFNVVEAVDDNVILNLTIQGTGELMTYVAA